MLLGKIECRIAEKFVILLARNNFCVKLFRKLFCIAYVIVVTVCKNYIFKLSAVFLNFRIEFFIRCARIGYSHFACFSVCKQTTVCHKNRNIKNFYIYHIFKSFVLISIVTGPSFTSETFMSAPKIPFSTRSIPLSCIFLQKYS